MKEPLGALLDALNADGDQASDQRELLAVRELTRLKRQEYNERAAVGGLTPAYIAAAEAKADEYVDEERRLFWRLHLRRLLERARGFQ